MHSIFGRVLIIYTNGFYRGEGDGGAGGEGVFGGAGEFYYDVVAYDTVVCDVAA
jgi:hypothetical protein